MNAEKINKVLDDIDKILCEADDTAKCLWDILTALRGPDDESCMKKDKYTLPIRAAAFPRTAKNVDAFIPNVAYIAEDPLPDRVDLGETGWHFGNHVSSAMKSLRMLNRTPYNK